jgi:hypothetical protein
MLLWDCSTIRLLTLLRHTSVIKRISVKRMVASIIVGRSHFELLTFKFKTPWTVNEPDLGRAGMPYARNVQSKKSVPLSSLPDPGLVFDTLLKAKDVRDGPFFSDVASDLLIDHLTACRPLWRKFRAYFRLRFSGISLLIQDETGRLDNQRY